ncbi:MAG: GNAT family N-acetyltransferase [Pseudomonadota bacterium]|nr:GNAT family N-acetyltransferase [Pseudomonadota bacterium]
MGTANAFTQLIHLKGTHAELVPLNASHHDDLVEAVKDGELWRHWYTFIPTPEKMADEIARRLNLHKEGSLLPFTVMVNGKAVGMTTYMHIDAANLRLEIGSTWYRASVHRSPVNTECKRMLLAHAFEQLHCNAVEFRTHFFNQQSRRAIERLGAKLDGILRNHQINQHPEAVGALRDTCVYSILNTEWPSVKAHLDYQLSRSREA